LAGDLLVPDSARSFLSYDSRVCGKFTALASLGRGVEPDLIDDQIVAVDRST
jgi:hypothetical protein